MEPSENSSLSQDEIAALVANAPKTPQERYERAVRALDEAKDGYERWCALGSLAKGALETERFDEAVDHAEELMGLVSTYEDDWNYGNAIQDSNIVLGMIALRQSNLAEACAHLLASGATNGSPQMNSFGPNMTLAKALIEAGEREAVLQYIELCRGFWEMDRGQLDDWSTLITSGVCPDFGPHLVY